MSDDLIGQKLGGFTIQSRVGQGGMASVFRAQQHSLDREVALKVIRRIPGDTMDVVARFQREKQMMQKLEHPNILPIYDYASNADYLWIAMRLVEGGTLPEVLTSPERLVSVAKQLASALDFAHSYGVVHRDIKPHNVLVDRGEHLYLTDFGVAKMLEQEGLTAPGMAVGTPEYMSPEHLSLKELDGRSDQYALAVMIYQLACGRLPFTGNMMEVMTAHMRTPPPPPTNLPPGASAALLKAMAKDPNERFGSCGEFAEALAGGFTGSRVVAVPASSRAPVSPLLKVGLGVLLFGAVGAAVFWQGGRAGKPGPLAFQAVHGDSSEIQLRSLDGIIQSLGAGKSPHFGPGDGQLTLLRDGDLQTIDLASKKASKLAEGVDDFDISPGALVFVRKGLMKWPIDQGKLKGKAAQISDEGSQPAFSPDGAQLTFAADRAIWVMDAGGRRRSLTSPPAGKSDRHPCWSPDGRQLAFVRSSGKDQASLQIIAVAGEGKEQAVPVKGPPPQDLSWAPNANIAFAASDGIYTVRPDGSDLKRVVESPKGVTLSNPEWGLAKP